MKVYRKPIALALSAVAMLSLMLTSCAPAAQTDTTAGTTNEVIVVDNIGDLLSDLYERINPAVVNIQVAQSVQIGGNFPEDHPELPDIFPELPEDQFQFGQGSGFVWDTEGHIVTNYHVVNQAERVNVTFSDGLTLEAEIVGTDPDSDLAVIQV
ncbi:MAG: trypsin-like peptidase domain-containing protein, partial [Anaerolineales bacterium]